MIVGIIVSLLEEHLKEIKSSLGSPYWENFLDKLERFSENLMPRRKDLEDWTDKVSELLSKYDYTRGLLKGLLFCASSGERGIPSSDKTLGDVEQPETTSARIPPDRDADENLVRRIKELITKARSLR